MPVTGATGSLGRMSSPDKKSEEVTINIVPFICVPSLVDCVIVHSPWMGTSVPLTMTVVRGLIEVV